LTAVAGNVAGLTATATAVTITVANGDSVPPTVSLTAPGSGSTVVGTISVTANAADNVGVAGVQFLLDGAALGAEVTVSPYTMTWNTTAASNGAHTLAARARDTSNNLATSASVGVTVSNPPPSAPVVDALVWADQATAQSSIISPAFSTTAPSELLLAFIATDYLSGTNTTVTSVTGAGLAWALVGRTNVQAGTSEIWRAFAGHAQ
jgi:hypothetical protein